MPARALNAAALHRGHRVRRGAAGWAGATRGDGAAPDGAAPDGLGLAGARADLAASGLPPDPRPAWLGRSVLFAATVTPDGLGFGEPMSWYPTNASAMRTAATPNTIMNAGRRCHCGHCRCGAERSSSSSRLVAATGPAAR